MGQLKQWLKEEWVRMDSKGNIIGSCGGRKEAEGKPRCLPKKKAQGMSKAARAKIVQRKRREDPNPNRKGKPINVSTKLRTGGMARQNKIKMKKGGFIAKGCGKVMSNRRKVTSVS
jgi:hypothetical protein